MPKCKSCGKKWGYIETVKSSWDFGKKMKCPHCTKNQYLTPKSRKRSMMSMFFIISPLALFFNSSQFTGLAALFVACLVFMGIWPFMVELSNKEDSLFTK